MGWFAIFRKAYLISNEHTLGSATRIIVCWATISFRFIKTGCAEFRWQVQCNNPTFWLQLYNRYAIISASCGELLATIQTRLDIWKIFTSSRKVSEISSLASTQARLSTTMMWSRIGSMSDTVSAYQKQKLRLTHEIQKSSTSRWQTCRWIQICLLNTSSPEWHPHSTRGFDVTTTPLWCGEWNRHKFEQYARVKDGRNIWSKGTKQTLWLPLDDLHNGWNSSIWSVRCWSSGSDLAARQGLEWRATKPARSSPRAASISADE